MSIQVHPCFLCGVAALALVAGGCGHSLTSNAAASAATPIATPAAGCLLSDGEARRVFPGAKAGIPDRKREDLGLPGCTWDTSDGGFGVHHWTATEGTVEDEIQGWVAAFVDPFNPAAHNNVRFESVDGVGDRAMAFAEPADEQRGILHDGAMLIAQRGDKRLKVELAGLPNGDRAAALRALTSLGRAAATRL